MTEQWQKQHEHGNRFLLGFLTWVALHLGRKAIFLLLCPIVFYYFLAVKSARLASRNFLTRALERKPRWWEIYLHILTFARVSMDRIYFLSGYESRFDVRVYGNELFNEYRKRGCFLLTAHIGSFDAMRVMGMGARSEALPLRILLDIQHNPNAMQLIQALDPELASGVIDAGTSAPSLALILSEAINSGQLIGIMADRRTQNDRTKPMVFLNGTADFPLGVWQFASLLHAPVIACFGIFKGGNRYDLHFKLIANQLGSNRKDRDAAITNGMQDYISYLEGFTRSNPYNWFNFYDFWHDETAQH